MTPCGCLLTDGEQVRVSSDVHDSANKIRWYRLVGLEQLWEQGRARRPA